MSDSLIVFASVTLNDGSGNVLRRRMLSMASSPQSMGRRTLLNIPQINDEERFKNALQQVALNPATESFPPLSFGVDVPYSIASIYGEENQKYMLINIDAIGRFDGMTTQQVNAEIMARVLRNKDKVCPKCRDVHPAFENMLPSSGIVGQRRRSLLQQGAYYAGSVTILLVYDSTMQNAIVISYPDILMSIYNKDFTPSLLPQTSTDEALSKLAADLNDMNVFVNSVKLAYPQAQVNVLVSMQDSLVYPDGTIPNSTVPDSTMQDINMGIYNAEYTKWVWKTDKFQSCKRSDQCENVPDIWKSS
jgi:hypothetical protein